VLRRCAQVEREQIASAPSAREVRSEGRTMSDCDLLLNSIMYMILCSLQCKNREMRMGKRRTIRKTNKGKQNDTRKSEKDVEWRGKAKGVIN
jgi:hypothetical protein